MVIAATALLVVGVVLAVNGKGDKASAPPTSRVVQPGAPGQSGRTLSPQELAGISAPPHTLADTLFFHHMVSHHAQALEMTALVAGRSESFDVARLAERITVSQRDEIAQIQKWLTDRAERSQAAHEGMPGMLNDEELAQLAAARGVAFDRLFLEFMIRHHEGALTMVQQLYANGGGLEPASDRFAREVEADQNIEIIRMRDMLAELVPAG